jgi:hypothetical protein
MRGKGIHHDTGTRMSSSWTREAFDRETAKRELRVITDDLHCTAVRVTGSRHSRMRTSNRAATP